jgi:hypothetical protein
MAAYQSSVVDTNTDATSLGYWYQPGSPTRRLKIYDIIICSSATPADNACLYQFQRLTAENGTPGGSSITPQALDPDEGAATGLCRSAPTGEPTKTASAFLLELAKNMRPTVRWVRAAPGKELIIPVTAANGIACVANTPTTAYAERISVFHEE